MVFKIVFFEFISFSKKVIIFNWALIFLEFSKKLLSLSIARNFILSMDSLRSNTLLDAVFKDAKPSPRPPGPAKISITGMFSEISTDILRYSIKNKLVLLQIEIK